MKKKTSRYRQKGKNIKLEEVNHKTKEAVDYLVQSLESGQSAVLTQYLGAMAKFRNYSFGKIMLIARQKPDATNVAGLRTWNSLGRFVRNAATWVGPGTLLICRLVQRTPAGSMLFTEG